MLKKSIYEAPEAELLVVRFEGNFCLSGSAGDDDTIVDDDEDY